MIELDGIDHIVLRTTRLQEMLAFYTNVLGCSVERETSEELGLTQLRAGTALIDLVSVDSRLGRMGGGAPAATGLNLDHFCLRLKPVSEATLGEHLAAHGLAHDGFGERYGAEGLGQSVYIKDPDGNTVELRSALK